MLSKRDLGVCLIAVSGLGLGCINENVTEFSHGSGRLDGGAGDGSIAPAFETSVRDAVPVADRGGNVIEADAACAQTTVGARRRPVNLLVVLDRSGSMRDNGKWTAAVSALQGLITRLDPAIAMGLTFFPAIGGAAGSANTYERPAVAVGPLRDNRVTLQTALRSASPDGNTPMACALEGTRVFYERFMGEGSRNVVLITDGMPTDECSPMAQACRLIPPDLACLAYNDQLSQSAVRVAVARAAMASPPVHTYVAGTPDASDQFLSDLAFTGGTARTPGCVASRDCHYSLRSGSFEDDLNRALDDIRGRAATCEFEVDADPSRVDPNRVNVRFTSGGGGEAMVIVRDVTHANGWDYSDGRRTIVLYGPACERLERDAESSVEILFGCPTATPG